jgi:hypothetical protein
MTTTETPVWPADRDTLKAEIIARHPATMFGDDEKLIDTALDYLAPMLDAANRQNAKRAAELEQARRSIAWLEQLHDKRDNIERRRMFGTPPIDAAKLGEAIDRVAAYLAEHARRDKVRNHSSNLIHALGFPDDGPSLLSTDLLALLGDSERLRTVNGQLRYTIRALNHRHTNELAAAKAADYPAALGHPERPPWIPEQGEWVTAPERTEHGAGRMIVGRFDGRIGDTVRINILHLHSESSAAHAFVDADTVLPAPAPTEIDESGAQRWVTP